jgi:hypothetical protein
MEGYLAVTVLLYLHRMEAAGVRQELGGGRSDVGGMRLASFDYNTLFRLP